MRDSNWFEAIENNREQHDHTQHGRNFKQGNAKKIQHSAAHDFRRRLAEEEPPSMNRLWHRTLDRFRRNLIALRYRFHEVTYGVLQKNAALKMIGLGAFMFYLFNAQNAIQIPNFGKAKGFTQEGTSTLNALGDESKGSAKTTKLPANEAAPIGFSGLKEEEARAYIARFAVVARAEMNKFGIPASISLAQGLVESRAGTSKLAVRNNNHFGMKCFSRKCKKGHCSNFTDDTHKDFFRKYGNAWESWRAHSEMLASGRYTVLKKYGKDYKQWSYGLKSLGYATDKTYAEKLIGMIERFELNQYDK